MSQIQLSTEKKKKKHNLKVESPVLFGRHSEDFKPGRQDFHVPLRDVCKEARWGEPGYTGAFATKIRYCNFKRLLLIKENQVSQVKEFNTSLCIGRCKS